MHCLYIGLVAKFRKQYTLAVEWLREAKRLATVERTRQDIPTVQAELIDTIKEVSIALVLIEQPCHIMWDTFSLQHDRLRDFQGFSNPNFFMTDIHSLHSTDGENAKVKDVLQSTYAGKGRKCSHWPMNVWALCSGENLHVSWSIPQIVAHCKYLLTFHQYRHLGSQLSCFVGASSK